MTSEKETLKFNVEKENIIKWEDVEEKMPKLLFSKVIK